MGKNKPRYRIVDQRRYDIINVEDIPLGEYFLVSVFKLVRNKQILEEFSVVDACLIGYIAGQLEAEHPFGLPMKQEDKVAEKNAHLLHLLCDVKN